MLASGYKRRDIPSASVSRRIFGKVRVLQGHNTRYALTSRSTAYYLPCMIYLNKLEHLN